MVVVSRYEPRGVVGFACTCSLVAVSRRARARRRLRGQYRVACRALPSSTDPGDLGLGDPGGGAHRLDQRINRSRRDTGHVCRRFAFEGWARLIG